MYWSTVQVWISIEHDMEGMKKVMKLGTSNLTLYGKQNFRSWSM